MFNKYVSLFAAIIILFSVLPLFAQSSDKPLVLQELGWVDVKEYLKENDMVIIPLGSTEQHGPHLPLGSDFYESFGISKLISARTGVVVAPVVFIGYSTYHSGFPGTLSLKPETMEQVVFETVEMLIKYGFRKIMFFNYHGGNNIVQTRLIHRINHQTEAVAVAIGVGGAIKYEAGESDYFDWHAGKSETSNLLFLRPDLVKLERMKAPEITFTPKMKALEKAMKDNPNLGPVWNSLFGVPVETGKGGASHELSSNGIWSFSNLVEASAEIGKEAISKRVDAIAQFIHDWREADPK